MNKQDGYISSKKLVSFYIWDRLDDKLDKIISMMNKLTAQGSNQNRLFKPERGGQARNNYNQYRYQSRYRSSSGDRRISYRGKGQYGQNYRGRSQYCQN